MGNLAQFGLLGVLIFGPMALIQELVMGYSGFAKTSVPTVPIPQRVVKRK